MKKNSTFMLVFVFAALVVGCGNKTHPVKVHVDPDLDSGAIERIAVFPFSSSVHDSDDPDEMAPKTMDRLFRKELDARGDYKFISPSSVEYALRGAGLDQEAKQFIDTWRRKKEVDENFIRRAAEALEADAVIVGVVDLWQKDEVDYRETSTPATYVGATITLFRLEDGKMLFEAADEDFLEGATSEAGDRGAMISGSGAVQSDRASNMYKAPEFEEVAVKVARALALSIPRR